jgi:putative flippase GtrA
MSDTTTTNRPLIHENPHARQFVKFCIVGLSSTVINFGFFNLLYHKLFDHELVPSLTIAFFLSVLNGFFWNRKWTFREARGHSPATQSLRFFAVNVVGWLLNTAIVVLVIAHYQSGAGHGYFPHFWQVMTVVLTGEGKKEFNAMLLNSALAVATCVVVFWNFFANRLWTFKH